MLRFQLPASRVRCHGVRMELFCTPTSPFARKARILFRELGLGVTEVMVDPLANDPRLLEKSPLGKVPVLLTDRGVVQDSRVIGGYFARLAGQDAAQSGFPADEVLEATADGVLDVAVSVVMERRRSPDETSPGFVDRQLKRIARTLDAHAVPASVPASAIPTRGQIAFACVLGYLDFRLPEVLWRERREDLADWFADLARRPSFIDTLPPGNA